MGQGGYDFFPDVVLSTVTGSKSLETIEIIQKKRKLNINVVL